MEIEENSNKAVLKVSARSPVSSLASAMSHAVYDGKQVSLRAIGAASVNQAMKATAIARGYVASKGLSISVVPGFTTVTMDDGEVTAMIFHIVVT